MKLNFKFSNLLGTVYHKGNLSFSPDGNSVISPVGNKITVSDLRNHRSETLPFESQVNITVVALSPNGVNGLLVNERGEALFVNFGSKVVLHRHRFNKTVKDIKFSPDGRRFAVCRDVDVQLFRAPDPKRRQYNPFLLEKVFHVAHDSSNFIDWSSDSKLFCVGCEDMQSKVCGVENFKNLFMCPVGGHTAPIVACFFYKNSFDLMTLDRKGSIVTWEASIDASQLIRCLPTGAEEKVECSEEVNMLNYKKSNRFYFRESLEISDPLTLKCADFHKNNSMLVTGFHNGAFSLHEMPSFTLIYSLSISECGIESLCLNKTGDWIAIGCSGNGIGQLLVWEWQSETYVMKQQGHTQNTNCLSYSPDGEFIATGGDDGKVKVWRVKSGFCLVTFSEHAGAVRGVAWSQGGKAVLSASLDGSVRAFDLKRYRNFRTMTTPEPVQLGCLGVDGSGEVVCAGGEDTFDIFLWSLQTGRLLEVLSGHEGPVSGITFSPSHPVLASTSWDKTLRIWDVFEGKGGKEVLDVSDEGLDVKFSPDGRSVGVLCLDSQITFFDWRRGEETGSIECRLDLDPGRGESEVVTAKQSGASKSFTRFNYSTNGDYVLVGGQCKSICLYSVKEKVLVKKFPVTCNYSLDSVAEDIDRRKLTEFGNLNLYEGSDSDEDESIKRKRKIKLPGVQTGDFSQRRHRPEIKVSDLQFSPTGRGWSGCTTEGILIYSLDSNVLFDPFMLSQEITPERVKTELRKCEFGKALLMALKLNESPLITEALEDTPIQEVITICKSMPLIYIEKLLLWLSKEVETTKHFEFYVIWIHKLLLFHGQELKQRKSENLPTFTSIQQVLTRKQKEIGKICEHNRYALEYILRIQKVEEKKEEDNNSDFSDSNHQVKEENNI